LLGPVVNIILEDLLDELPVPVNVIGGVVVLKPDVGRNPVVWPPVDNGMLGDNVVVSELSIIAEDVKVPGELEGDDPTTTVPEAAPVPIEADVLKYPELVLYP